MEMNSFAPTNLCVVVGVLCRCFPQGQQERTGMGADAFESSIHKYLCPVVSFVGNITLYIILFDT